MRNRGLERRLALGPFSIEVNPLPVFRRFCEKINPLLSYRQPIGHRNFAAHKIFKDANRLEDKWRQSSPPSQTANKLLELFTVRKSLAVV